jgi:plastocyanin
MTGRARTFTRFARRAATILVTALAALVILGCGGGGSAVGLEAPPASLDPTSPTLSAEGLAFDTGELAAPANEAFVIVFENREAVSHNVSIYADEPLRDRRFEGVLFAGPATRWYPVPALAPGSYTFLCDLHPTMRGTLTAT